MSTNSSLSSPSEEYPYPVTQNISNFVSIKLSSNNFFLWKTQMINILESYDLQGFLNGEISTPPEMIVTSDSMAQSNPVFLKWRRTDRLVKGWLTATLSEEVLGIVVSLGTAAEVWNALVHAFARASFARSLALKQRLTSITHGTDNLSTYLRRFKTIYDELVAIGKPVSDQKKSWWLLNGLGKDFKIFTATMLQPPVPSYSEVVTQLESYAEWHNINSPAQPPMVFYGQKTYKNRKGQGQSASFNSKGRGFTQGNQSAHKTSNSFGQSFGSNQSRGNKKDDSLTCQICNKKYHTAIKCFERFNHSFTTDNLPQAFSTVQVGDTEDSPWHPNTSATDHMTASTSNLQSVTPYTKSNGVMVGNGHILPITHIGTATLSSGSSSIKLNDVLIVPDIQKDLLSVSNLTSNYPLIFEFNGPGLVLKDRISKQIIAKGWKRKGLYTFEGSQDHSTSITALFSSSDEGGEFASSPFKQYLHQHGIHHQSACPKTPEQNGKAERMHRSITELGLAMMFHAQLPSRFWLDCFSTTVFLLNRLPSITLDMDSSYARMYGKVPDYGTFRVFGSQCFPYLGAYCRNKLEPKSLPCVFLGYSTKHKGYKCLYPPTGRVYVSRHVVFDESLLPYSKPTALYGEPPVEGEFCIFEEHADILSPSAFASPSNMSHSPTMPPSQPAPASDMRREVSQHDAAPHDATPVLCPDTSHATAASVSPHDNSQLDSLSREQLQHTMITRAKSGVQKSNPKYANLYLTHPIPSPPKSIKSAKNHPGCTESEYRSMAATAAELAWLSFLLHDLDIPLHKTPALH
ncbi:hypothetical protein F0562_019529 [Nyssa sinensis]|uniref:Integrase catalytic domain-containing protein n=1 Tax=Nyssa sinensis TaxID=561372 RepID=A0A5J5BSM7_9ASTE|nr:hypothetical protein F0562_019529 [Nyssa sinensis]